MRYYKQTTLLMIFFGTELAFRYIFVAKIMRKSCNINKIRSLVMLYCLLVSQKVNYHNQRKLP